jgi:RNA polymerase sigma-70 factor (ECF subfamily)
MSGPARRFEGLYRAEARALLGYALRRVAQPEDAADIVAETMLVAWRRLDDVPSGSEARPWLFGVARRVLANGRRGSRRRRNLAERLRSDLGALLGPDQLGAVETNVVVRAALARLDPDDREILRLTSWEGLQPHEIAVVVEMRAATVRTRLHRARQRLRHELARDELAEHDGERRPPTGQVRHDEQELVRDAEDER